MQRGPASYARHMSLFLRLLVSGLLVFSLAACAPGGNGDDDDAGTSVSQQDDDGENDDD